MHVNGFTYAQLNKAINEVFFDGRYQGKYVYLDLELDKVNEVSDRIGCRADELPNIVSKITLSTLSLKGDNAYSFHLRNAHTWLSTNRQQPPPFTTLLLCLSMAAEKMRHDKNYSASNYYFRLFETLNINNVTHQNIIRSSGGDTITLWHSLNKWLTENDYSFGIPTAKQINSWRYVSYAISQSLVREAEREKFRQMFREMGITSQDRLGFSDVEIILYQWMGSSTPSPWLKKLWAQNDLKERVVTAALYELEKIDEHQRRNVTV